MLKSSIHKKNLKTKGNFKNRFGFLWEAFKKKEVRNLFLLGTVFLLANAGLALVFPKLYSAIIDDFFAQQQFNVSQFILTGGLGLLAVAAAFGETYILNLASERLGFVLREKLFTKIIHQPEKFFHQKDTAKLLTVIMNDINNVKQILASLVSNSIFSILILTGSIFLMFSISPSLSWTIILSVGLATLLIVFLTQKIGRLFQGRQEERDKFNRIIKENVKASTLIRVFVAEKLEINKFARSNQKTQDLSLKINQRFSLIIPLVNFANYLASFWILFLGGQGVINGNISLGDITALQNYVTMFIMPILSFGFMSTMIGQALVSLERIGEIITEKTDFIDGEEKMTAEIKQVKLENISFQAEDNEILHKVNLEVNRGEKIGIIGLTGSGKSLALKTMVRLIEPSQGEVLINQKNINDYTIDSLRQKIGFVFQNDYLVDGSIKDNIKFGRKVESKTLQKVVRIADVDQIINKFKDGLDHGIGEGGRKLSGGQKQRVRIARALATNPELLILDDCTSNLDIKTEKKIINNIKKYYQDISLIIVSEKVASIKDCDRIYVFDNGKIIGSGTHRELLETTFLYQEIELTQKNYA